MASGKLGSGHRDFPFLTIIGNGTTQPRHSLNTLYGIRQTRREHPSASSSKEEQAGCSMLGRRTSGVLRVVIRASPTVSGCDCITTVSGQTTRKLSSRSLPVLNISRLKLLRWKVDNYCAGFSLKLEFRLKLRANRVKMNFSAVGTIHLKSDSFYSRMTTKALEERTARSFFFSRNSSTVCTQLIIPNQVK